MWGANDASGVCISTLTEHTNSVQSVCISRDDRLLVSAGTHDNSIKVWDIPTKTCNLTIGKVSSNGGVNSVCISQNGRYVFAGCYDGSIKKFNVSSGALLSNFKGHTQSVHSVCISPDDCFIYSSSWSKMDQIKKFEISTGSCLLTLPGVQPGCNSVCVSHTDGLLLASGSLDNMVRLYDMSPNAVVVPTNMGHSDKVWSVCVTRDNLFAFSGSADKSIKQWSLSGFGTSFGSCVATFIGHSRSVKAVCLSPDDKFLYSGSDDNTIKKWSISPVSCVITFNG